MNLHNSPQQRLEKIVKHGMCIGCGICESIVGHGKIKIKKSEKGMLIPCASELLDDSEIERIYAVCRGTRVEGLPENLIEEHTNSDLIWGPYQSIRLSWAS